MVQIFNRLEREFEFSRSFNSMMIWPEDMDDSSCLERHCSVLRMSLLWQPYSFFNTMGRDSARLTRLTSMMASRVWPSAFLSCSTRWVTCLYVCRFTSTSLKASSFALFAWHVRGQKTCCLINCCNLPAPWVCWTWWVGFCTQTGGCPGCGADQWGISALHVGSFRWKTVSSKKKETKEN